MTRARIVAALAVLLLLVAGCSSGHKAAPMPSQLNDQTGSGPYMGFGLTPPQPRPSFVLTDTSGQQFSFGTATAGRPTFLYFGYTHCPDICPTTMADIGLALQKVPASLRSKAQVVFVTTDVKEDTGPVIAAWLKAFQVPGLTPFIGLYGSQAQIDAAESAARVPLATDGGQTHSAQVLLYGSDDYARVSYVQSNNETAAMAHDLPLVAQK